MKFLKTIPPNLSKTGQKEQSTVFYGIYDGFTGKRLMIDINSKNKEEAMKNAARFNKDKIVVLSYSTEIKNIGSVEKL